MAITKITPRRLLQIRKRLGLTQAQLAERLGVGTASVYRWETGKTTPSPLALRRINEILDAA